MLNESEVSPGTNAQGDRQHGVEQHDASGDHEPQPRAARPHMERSTSGRRADQDRFPRPDPGTAGEAEGFPTGIGSYHALSRRSTARASTSMSPRKATPPARLIGSSRASA